MRAPEVVAEADAAWASAAHMEAPVLLVGEVAVAAHEWVATGYLDGVIGLATAGAALQAIERYFRGVGGARGPVEAHRFAAVAQATVAPLAGLAPHTREAGGVCRGDAGSIRRPERVHHVGQPPSAWVSTQPPTTEAGNPRERIERTSANFVQPPATAPPRDQPFGSRARLKAFTG